ncbi:MAG: hypothetical protein U9O98_08645 [Asgard group archaeon]|nr:hypothetical protein [Asgard group archaeon]
MNKIIAKRIYNLIQHDPAKIAILNLLADGEWHTRYEVESKAKNYRPTIGIVGLCVIIRSIQEADTDLIETYENDSGRFYRINPQRNELIKRVIYALQKQSKQPVTESSSEFQRFKDILRSKRKKDKMSEDNIRQFL